MSLITGQLLTGTPSASKPSASGSSSTAAAGTAGMTGLSAKGGAAFNSTLVQLLSAGLSASNEENQLPAQALNTESSAANLLSAQLGASTASDVTEGQALLDKLPELLEGLMKDTDKLEDLAANDPALLQALQQWVAQLQSLLNQMQDKSSSDAINTEAGPNEEGQQMLIILAQQPETLKFALQDGLTQLAQGLQGQQQSKESLAQFKHLLQSLEQIQVNSVSSAGSSNVSSFSDNLKTLLNTVNFFENHTDVLKALVNTKGDSTAVQAANVTTAADPAAADGDLTVRTAEQPSDSAGTAGEQQNSSNSESNRPENLVTTAGHLQMKNGSGAPVKPAAEAVVQASQFTKEMSGFMVNKLEIVKQNGFTEAIISLRPEQLGQVDVRLSMQNGHLIAQFMTDNHGAKELIEQQMAQLRASLQSQGIQVEKVEVTSNASLSSHMYQDGRNSGSGQQQQSDKRSRSREEMIEDSLTVAELGEELRSWNAEQRQEENGRVNGFTARA
ncbi:flagellar hook-length control protein FliK [Paenibacillus sp. JX-17]|uniref:Flagellar hook-length control protein FliK n=1 Tax=Paenibacillus lacisoli TaxID=3064525 RepID=A0ABT9CAC6_9BACL|nr:flagellar hook-length control protein FliK [Paenibacillus sp. JX-17]MDO7905830.1 flagellar hook-length control protein FliK [Paenibacillus sp. JX-17]